MTATKKKQRRFGLCICFLLIGSYQNLKYYFDDGRSRSRIKNNKNTDTDKNTDYYKYTSSTTDEYLLDAPSRSRSYNHRINNTRVVDSSKNTTKAKTKTKTKTTDLILRQRQQQQRHAILHDFAKNNDHAADADNIEKANADADADAGVVDADLASTRKITTTTTHDHDLNLTTPPPPKTATATTTTTIKKISIISSRNNSDTSASASASATTHSHHHHHHHRHSPRIVGLIDNNGYPTSSTAGSYYSYQEVYKIIKKISNKEQKMKNENNNKMKMKNNYYQENPIHIDNVSRDHSEDIGNLEHQLYVNQNSDYKNDCIYPNDNTANNYKATDFYAVYKKVKIRNNENEDENENERSGGYGSGSGDDNNSDNDDDDDDNDNESSIWTIELDSSSSSDSDSDSYSYSSSSNNKERVWQKQNYPICNTMHELGILGNEVGNDAMINIKFLGKGSWRAAYLLDDNINNDNDNDNDNDDNDDSNTNTNTNSNKNNKIVIKMFGLDTDFEFPFDIASYEMHRVDSIISQKMTSSSYILDIYGHCGLSGLYEHGYDDLDHIAKNRKNLLNAEHELTLQTKIQFSYEVIKAIYDLHTIDYTNNNNINNNDHELDRPGPATIIHGDIKPENFIIVKLKGSNNSNNKGSKYQLKLNDFNYSILRKFNRTAAAMSTSTSTSTSTSVAVDTGAGEEEKENEHEEVQVDNIKEKVIACPYYTNRVPLSWGVGYRPYEFSIANYPPIDENIDIFGLGGVLYYILEGNDPYWQYTKDHELEEISNGLLPPIKATTTNDIDDIDTRRIINTIIDIINNSMSLNPNERPTSKHVLEQFLNAFNTTNNTS